LEIGLAQRIIDAELPGIAYWALQGALRLLQNDKFSDSVVHDRLMAKWRKSTNSLEEYLEEICDTDDVGYSIKRSDLYSSYQAWCMVSGRKPYSKSHFHDLLVHNTRLGITLGSKDGYGLYRGVRLKKPVEIADLY
jgi:putative DNA primase/helicase